MTPTRDHSSVGIQLDSGVGSPVASRPLTWAYIGPGDASVSDGGQDTGIGSSLAGRSDTLDNSNAFIPPLWL